MRYLILLLMPMACCGGCVLAEAPATHDPATLQALVKQLGSRDFDEREDAKLKLSAVGEAAREVLTKALKDADTEVSASAALLLDKINRAVLAVRVVDSTEKPLAEVPVIFNLYLLDSPQRDWVLRNETVTTDANGWASVGNLRPRGGYFLHVSCEMPDHVIAEYRRSMELKVKRYELKLVALRSATVTGTLLDKAQAPLTDCLLVLVPSNCLHLLQSPKHLPLCFRNALMATTDERGQFKFEQVNPGEYAMALGCDKGLLLWRSDTIQVEAEETLALGVLATGVDPAALKRNDDVLTDDGEDAAPEK